MHDECKVFAKALENATKAVEATNEVNKRLYKLFLVTVIAIILLVLLRDYIQYNASYDYPKTAITEKGGQ